VEGIRIGAGTLRGTYPYLRLMAAYLMKLSVHAPGKGP
jgi:hypothetical protein